MYMYGENVPGSYLILYSKTITNGLKIKILKIKKNLAEESIRKHLYVLGIDKYLTEATKSTYCKGKTQ